MANTDGNTEARTANEEKFDIDEAFRTKGFTEFLAKFPDAENFNVNDPEKVQDRFLAFAEKEKVKTDLKDLFRNQIKKEMGLELSDADLALIDRDLEKNATKPGYIIDLRTQIDSFKSIPLEIQQFEKELADLGKKEEFLAEQDRLGIKRAQLETAKDYLGFMGGIALRVEVLDYYAKAIPNALTKVFDFIGGINGEPIFNSEDVSLDTEKQKIDERFSALEYVKNRFGNINKNKAGLLIDSTETDIENVKNAIGMINTKEEQITKSKQLFDRLKKDLFGKVTAISSLREIIQDKVKNQFYALTHELDQEVPVLSDLKRAKDLFTDLKERFKSSETGVNPLGNIDERGFIKAIDGDMEIAISDMIEDKLSSAHGFGELESALGSILGAKEVGFKKDNDVKEVIVRTLENVRDGLSGNDRVVKKLLLSRIIGKVKSDKY